MKKILIFSIFVLISLTIGFFSIIHFSEETKTVSDEPKQDPPITEHEKELLEEYDSISPKQLTKEEVPNLKIGDVIRLGDRVVKVETELTDLDRSSLISEISIMNREKEKEKIKAKKLKIKTQILSEEKPIKYTDESEQRISAYTPFHDDVGWEIRELSDISDVSDIKDYQPIRIDTAALVNQTEKIKQIEIQDLNGETHVLDFKEKRIGHGEMTVIRFSNKYSVAGFVVDDDLNEVYGRFTLKGELNYIKIKANKGYIYTVHHRPSH